MEYKVTEEAMDFLKRMIAEGHISQEVAERYFPALKEPVASEDEKIRKALKVWLQSRKYNTIRGILISDILLWLENKNTEAIKEALKTEYEKGRADAIAELEKRPTWTETDRNLMAAAIAFVQQNNSFNCWAGTNKHEVIAFLHSIKPQSQWKPSEEQMEILVWCLPLFVDPKSKETLKSLIYDLKKL